MSDREGSAADAPASALAAVRVIEWSRGIAGSYAARMLADFGADVVRVPVADAVERSIACAAFLDQRKTTANLQADTVHGVHELLRDADILINDFSPAERAAARIDRAALATVNPRLISVAVTPFGLDGPYSEYRGGDLEVAFLAGLAHLTPRDIAQTGAIDDTPPLKMPGSLVSFYGGASAAGAALSALHGRRLGAGVQEIDVSLLETLIPTLRREIALYGYEGKIASRFMRVWRLAPWGVKRCSDGHVFVQVVEAYHWQGLADMMGRPEWALDSRYLDADYRFEHRADIESRMAPWLLTQTKAAFGWESQRRGLPFAPVNEPADLPRIAQLHARGFFRCAQAGDGRAVMVPGLPYRLEHRDDDAMDSSSRRTASLATARPAANPALPLRDLRVIDFGHVWAGPYCTALLADLGAEVIKVESQHRLDIHRRQGPYPDGRAGIDRSGVWNAQNRNKRSVTLNLSTPRGRALARSLVATADVVVENFAPGVMQRLGLDYASLAALRPGLVMASLSAFGQQGPQRAYVGYGPSLDAWAGLDALTAYANGEPNALGGVFPDTGSALHAAAAILAALHERDRNGRGCYIDLSELEVSILLLADIVADDLAGAPPAPRGNADAHRFPYGCYRCAGADAWLALSVPDVRAWHGLCDALGRVDWRDDVALATVDARQRHGEAIERAIAAWTRAHAADEAMRILQANGVPAGMSHTTASLLADPHLVARGYFATVDHAEAGPMTVYGGIWRFAGPPAISRAAPRLGEDNAHVLSQIMKLSGDDIAALTKQGVVY